MQKSEPAEDCANEEKSTIHLHPPKRVHAHGKPISRAILLMINVSFTISFVSFHISFRTTSHSILSFRSSIVRTYNLHSLRLHPKMYFLRKKGYFLVCSAPFQRRFFSRRSFRPLHRQLAVHPAHAISYPLRIIFSATPTVRTTTKARQDEMWKIAGRAAVGVAMKEPFPYELPFSMFTMSPYFARWNM